MIVWTRRVRTLVATVRLLRRRHELRREIAAYIRLPDRSTVSAMDPQCRIHPGKMRVNILEVAHEEVLGPRVVRRRDDLRKIDDRWSIDREQDVVRRQISVHEIAAEESDHLRHQIAVHAHHRIALQGDLFEPRRRPTLVVEYELHQQNAFVEHHRRWRPHAGIDEPIQRIRLRRLPRLLGGVAAEPAAAVHRTLGPRIANFAAFLVLDVVLEAPHRAVLVDLRREHHITAADQRDGRLFAAFDPAKDLVDHAIGEQKIE
ncbi:MAG TPA: hypothetical protein VFQ65_29435 [Kofleriaceae bacterium]|nr:hypothetical protein [Kofleriaceae bacterium]